MFHEVVDQLKFKQDRTLFMVADPRKDMPLKDLNFEKFYDVKFTRNDIPAFVIVQPK